MKGSTAKGAPFQRGEAEQQQEMLTHPVLISGFDQHWETLTERENREMKQKVQSEESFVNLPMKIYEFQKDITENKHFFYVQGVKKTYILLFLLKKKTKTSSYPISLPLVTD